MLSECHSVQHTKNLRIVFSQVILTSLNQGQNLSCSEKQWYYGIISHDFHVCHTP